MVAEYVSVVNMAVRGPSADGGLGSWAWKLCSKRVTLQDWPMHYRPTEYSTVCTATINDLTSGNGSGSGSQTKRYSAPG